MESHYSPEFLAARKTDLLRLKADTEQELSGIAKYDEASGSWMAIQPEYDADSTEDVGDSSGESEELLERHSEVESLEKTLVEIDNALAKFETGAYGRCETSGEWLDEARLTAYPAARTCSEHE